MTAPLARRLGTADAVTIGLAAMIGAGVFSALGPAAAAAGAGLLPALAIAALIAYCNATSTLRLALRYPTSGGAYVYGRERLGPLWGNLAGWCFVLGKTASCAAMALTVGQYLWPDHARLVAVAAVLALTTLTYFGVHRGAKLARVIVTIVLICLVALGVLALTTGAPQAERLVPHSSTGVLTAAALLFFAFAGYARIATLGEEVRDPRRTLTRAVPLALAIALAVYTLLAVAALATVGAAGLAASPAPLRTVLEVTPLREFGWVISILGAVAALGALLALVLGVSRTALAMARDGNLPRPLAAVHPRHQVPHRAEVVVGLLAATAAATLDLRQAIGLSSFGVLLYYAVANAAAWTLEPEFRPARWIPIAGLVGCVLLAGVLIWGGGAW
ncbi:MULTISPECIES: APC family permease [unclassified Crossiella]|uniref:APC family permease n=1 Tax=unclassified Crossiella TaxID=2620835 RepID=UPI001FFF6648|nr:MULTISPECIES: APC family permease [unclassified Crossiella]MCK2243007.1 APC family permease [Crossiella sp. S99.2]MCK2256884.1 APC family permease [Crossiella sp. S99.1]